MDIDRLVEQITDIVISRLASAEGDSGRPDSSTPEPPVSKPARMFRGVIVLTEMRPQMEEFWEHLRACSRFPVEWIVFASADVPMAVAKKNLQSFPAQVHEALPGGWKPMIAASDFMIAPVMTMTLCSKIINLIADDLPSMVTLQFLIEKKHIIVGAEEIHFLNRFCAQLPKPLVNVNNAHVEMMRSMGLIEVEMNKLERELAALIGRTAVFGKANNVITKADVEAAMEEGRTTLEFLRGTIITPLARAYAEEKNIQIVLR